MKWHLTQIGSRENYLYPRIINRRKTLGTFSTDIWFKYIHSLPLSGSLARMKSRYHEDLKNVDVKSRNIQSIYRMLKPFSENKFDQWCAQGETFGHWAADNIIRKIENTDTVFGYTGGCLEISKVAKSVGARMILGQFDPAFYWYEVQNEEYQRWQGQTMNGCLPTEKYKERLLKEWEYADIIIVNSEHCKKALIPYGVDETKIKVLPLPVSIDIDDNYNAKSLNHKQIKIIFVGNISFGKGFAYFAEAKKILENDKRFSFYAIGDLHISSDVIKKNNWKLNYTGRLNREQLKRIYLESHILVFPTLSEGFGQVQLEAMAYGLPVISTNRCGQIVENGSNGLLIKAGEASAIVSAILNMVDDRERYNYMSYCALQTISKYGFLEIEKKFWNIFN